MNRSNILATLVASTALLFSASANASVWLTTGGTSVVGEGQVSSLAPTTYDMSSTIPTFTGSPVLFATGDTSSSAAPYDDATQYASVGSVVTPGTTGMSLVAGADIHYFGLYWGSRDAYNSITISDAGGNTTTINSSTFPILDPATGDRGLAGSAYVNIFDNFAITGITFSSSQKAFEFDNVALAGAVPEVSTWAMMILGFVGLGFLGYRKSRSSNPAFRFA
ncbi:hypothetical protein [Bradyrhizobium ganzhouense]|uniref:Npun_F0296 family exosortase-dependent surface protein n=1 Tax=Bradyrhizobium ganzhouense TaxID=1179767 RepID=UPI003CEBB109